MVLFQCRIFSDLSVEEKSHKTKVKEEKERIQNNFQNITLENLWEIRKHPLTSCLRNLLLCDSIDCAETELVSLHPGFEDSDYLLLVESTPKKNSPQKQELLQELQERIKNRKIFLMSCIQEIYVDEFIIDEVQKIVLQSVTENPSRPIIIHFGSPASDPLLLLKKLESSQVDLSRVLVSGIVFSENFFERIFLETRVTFILAPRGGSVVDIEMSDTYLDTFIAKFKDFLKKDISRFVLGLDFLFAIQLKRFGGPGYSLIFEFLEKLTEKVSLTEKECSMLLKGNAIRLLSFEPEKKKEEKCIEEFYTCAYCGKQVLLKGDNFFESHNCKFCSAVCMRKFRETVTNQDSSNNGNRRRTENLSNTGSWSINV